ELWRSDDGGEKWTRVSQDLALGGRGAYYTRCKVTPDDPDEIYFMAASYSYSTNGGKTTQAMPSQPNWDHHEMWIDPSNGNRQAVAGDGGVSITQNRGKSWFRVQLPVAQLYHVTVDNNVPYNVYANRQDGPSTKGPSRFFTEDFLNIGIPRGEWHDVGGGESGFATPDPVDPDVVWSSASGSGAGGGIVVKYNEKARQFRQVEVWPEATFGSSAKEVKYRFQWTFPLLISPHDRNTVYVTSQHVHKTTNGGQTWTLASPDLTTNDKSKQNISGGLTPDNIGVEYCCVIYALDESPVQKDVLWAGTNDGLVQVTQDGGKNWENITKNIKGLPPLGTVRNIEASKWKAGKAYITIDFHQVGNFEPWVYKTEDFGKTWIKITDGIPKSNLSYACNIREDPTRAGLLYLGTENALYVSFNDGLNWQSIMTNMPSSPMYWLQVQENFNDLVIGTYGRGIWILDDITPLQQMTNEVTSSAAHLFAPRQAYRFHPITGPFAMFDDQSDGDNPPMGASINYWLAVDAKDSLLLTVKDANNAVVRKLYHRGKSGLNRIWWDLREDPSTAIVMRNKPIHAEWITLSDKRTMNAPTSPKGISPLVLPGTYTVVLKVGDKEYSQPLKVLKDPNSQGTESDIAAQKKMLSEIKKDMSTAADVINQLEWLRRQAADLKSIAEDQKNTDVTKAIDEMEKKLIDVEGELIQLKITPQGQGAIRWPAQVVEKLQYLGSTTEVADFAPADQYKEVHQILQKRLQDSQTKFNQLLEKDLPLFQDVLKKNNFNGPMIMKAGKVVN
ncbi:MAG: glycosyl hydrolase, partial [Flammeovirgaceae bacterium]